MGVADLASGLGLGLGFPAIFSNPNMATSKVGWAEASTRVILLTVRII